jgi:hypothetical protein
MVKHTVALWLFPQGGIEKEVFVFFRKIHKISMGYKYNVIIGMLWYLICVIINIFMFTR